MLLCSKLRTQLSCRRTGAQELSTISCPIGYYTLAQFISLIIGRGDNFIIDDKGVNKAFSFITAGHCFDVGRSWSKVEVCFSSILHKLTLQNKSLWFQNKHWNDGDKIANLQKLAIFKNSHCSIKIE